MGKSGGLVAVSRNALLVRSGLTVEGLKRKGQLVEHKIIASHF